MKRNTIIVGDCLETMQGLPDRCVSMCVTSPPYWGLRDYGVAGQHGQEPTPAEFVARMVEVFREVRRILQDDGTLWLNLGDSYASVGGPATPHMGEMFVDRQRGQQVISKPARGRTGKDCDPKRGPAAPGQPMRHGISGLKPKDLVGIPWRVALALQDDGWWLRQDIIWHKPNPMPESVTDRCTKAHEYLFLLTKSERYYYDQDAILEPGATSSTERLSQPTLASQAGSSRVPGKTNGNMKAVSRPRAAGVQHKQEAVGNNQGGYLGSNDPFIERNKRSVWSVTTKPYKGAHFATFPPELIRPCILAGCRTGGLVFDPYGGSGTTGQVARALGRDYLLCELNPDYAKLAEKRIKTPIYDNSPKTPKPCAGQRELFAAG